MIFLLHMPCQSSTDLVDMRLYRFSVVLSSFSLVYPLSILSSVCVHHLSSSHARTRSIFGDLFGILRHSCCSSDVFICVSLRTSIVASSSRSPQSVFLVSFMVKYMVKWCRYLHLHRNSILVPIFKEKGDVQELRITEASNYSHTPSKYGRRWLTEG